MDLDRAALDAHPGPWPLEWLEADGAGGFALGSVEGPATRRYHGLLVLPAPGLHLGEGALLLGHLEQRLELDGRAFSLAAPFADSPGEPARLLAFSSWPWPRWSFQAGQARVVRELCLGAGQLLLRWSLEGASSARLWLRPFLAGRAASQVRQGPPPREGRERQEPGLLRWHPWPEAPPLFLRHPGGYRPGPRTTPATYQVDRARGEPWREDWWSPGELGLELAPGRPGWLVASSEPPRGEQVEERLARERERRQALEARAPSADPLFRDLLRASAAFPVHAPEGWALLAGYPWFGPWGRDTFTSLPGLLLATRRFEVARAVLEAFGSRVDRGMVPHLLAAPGQPATYADLDTALWFVRAAGYHLRYTGDAAFARELLWPACRKVVEGYAAGSRLHIGLDDDGLLRGGAPGAKLTWMDAEYQGRVFTPRRGKPVEVQALWAHALAVTAGLARLAGDQAFAARCAALRAACARSFRRRFWCRERGWLYDVVDGEGGDDARLRPNQLFALALADDLVPPARAARVLAAVEAQLLTPAGLRSLAPAEPGYRGRYQGPRAERDPAYHNGTAWPFLWGPWLRARLRRAGGRAAAARVLAQARSLLARGCLGHLPEIADGDPPHLPRGSPAQAWNAGELLLVLDELLGRGPARGVREARDAAAPGA